MAVIDKVASEVNESAIDAMAARLKLPNGHEMISVLFGVVSLRPGGSARRQKSATLIFFSAEINTFSRD